MLPMVGSIFGLCGLCRVKQEKRGAFLTKKE